MKEPKENVTDKDTGTLYAKIFRICWTFQSHAAFSCI